nr:hypothetical protein [Tanacetum cinerariifolium]
EGILEKEPRFDDEETDVQRALEESLKGIYDAPRSPLPPVVIREPDSGKYQLLPEVQEKGKEKATDVSTQLHPKQMDEGFTATAYPNVQENLKLTVEEQVILEEPASSTGTLSSLQHLAKDLSFGDLFFNDKQSEADNEKTTIETEAELMVSVTIQQDTSSIPPMTTPIIDLTSRPNFPNRIGKLEQIIENLIQDNKHLEERLDSHGACLYTLENLDIPQQVHLELQDLLEILDHHKCRHHLLHLHPPTRKVHSSHDEDIGNAHIPKVNLRQDWWKPLEEDRPATPKPAWFIPSSDLPVQRITGHMLLRPPIHLYQRTRYPRRLVTWQCLWTGSVNDKESVNSNHKT